MEYQSRPTADVPTRVMSVFSLIIALGALALFLTSMRNGETEQELKTSFDQQLAQQARRFTEATEALEKKYQEALDRQDERNADWNTKLNTALQTFGGDATALLTQIQQDSDAQADQRQLTFRQTILDLETLVQQAQGATSDESLAGITAPLNARRQAGRDAADARPEITSNREYQKSAEGPLRIVSSSLRPATDGGADQSTLVVLENTTNQPINLTRARFRPQSRFPVANLNPNPATDDAVSIEFEQGDNNTSTPGFHGTYDRLLSGIIVPPNQRVTLRVAIADEQFAGWGFTGKLVLSFGVRQALEVDAARVVFR